MEKPTEGNLAAIEGSLPVGCKPRFKSPLRLSMLPREHQLYTSQSTLSQWLADDEVVGDYDSIGWLVSRPPEGKAWNEYYPKRIGRVSVCERLQRRYRDSTTLIKIPAQWLYGILLQPVGKPHFLQAAEKMMRRLRWRETGNLSLLRPSGRAIAEPRKRQGIAPQSGDVRFRGGYPAIQTLAKYHPSGALAVLQYVRSLSAESTLFHYPDRTAIVADNDNIPNAINSPDFTPEKLHDIKPSVNDVMADLLRVRFVRYSDGKVHRINGMSTRAIERNSKVVLAGMTFWRNPAASTWKTDPLEMQSYIDPDGRVQKPKIIADKPRGGKGNYRDETDIATYLKLRGAVPSPLVTDGLRTPISGEPVLMPLLTPMLRRPPNTFMDAYGKLDAEGRFGVTEARELLIEKGVDGTVAFEDLPFPATRCSLRRAKGARFVGGVTGSKPTRTMSGPAKVAEPVHVSDEIAIVLEEVAARSNLAGIGMRLGKSKSYADRAGKQALIAAANALIAANDDTPKKLTA